MLNNKVHLNHDTSKYIQSYITTQKKMYCSLIAYTLECVRNVIMIMYAGLFAIGGAHNQYSYPMRG